MIRTIRRLGGLDPDVVESAGLAHDLGHPPFGHVAERELNAAVRPIVVGVDGYEGNAQAFRIVTKLSAIDEAFDGLNLTRATLNAILKYPRTGAGRFEKYGVYTTELLDFEWAREGLRLETDERTLEAEIMDWADDIAYSVHDADDFYRAGLIRFAESGRDWDRIFEGVVNTWYEPAYGARPKERELVYARRAALSLAPGEEFRGTWSDRAHLRKYTTERIARLVRAASVSDGRWKVNRAARVQAELLKQLTRHYVVGNVGLATQQDGQRLVTRELFAFYWRNIRTGGDAVSVFPPLFLDIAREVSGPSAKAADAVRVVADVVAGMTEVQALRVHERITAVELGPLLDPAIL